MRIAVTMSPPRDIQRCIRVGIRREAALPTAKHLFMSLAFLSEPTRRTGEACAGWVQQHDRNANHRSKQLDSASKLTPSPLLISGQLSRVFQAHSSTGTLSYEHSLSGFAGEHLSLMCDGLPVNAIALLVGFPLFCALNDWSQIRAAMAVTADDRSAQTDITPYPPLRRLDFRQGDRHRHSSVPFVILAHDFC
jgi:hypothetical protein